ncbi:type VII secretion target [Nocardia carnea]|uniref:Type VII secretion target n=1 Tax=Nocardia carnea TaxID=37328 RepID=A0ABW7TJI6_9NOCA|nr:type VII secretion target [Nocardia carnea]
MPERLDIDPELLRRLALQHDQVAAETREWAQPPSDWLANFEPTYGKIANPVKEALERYYTARLRAGEALAREHEETARSLRESADTYERTDAEGAAALEDPDADTRRTDPMFGSPAPSVNGPAGNSTGGPVPVGAVPPNGSGAVPGGTTPPSGIDQQGAGTPAGAGAATPGATSAPGAVPAGENTAATGATPATAPATTAGAGTGTGPAGATGTVLPPGAMAGAGMPAGVGSGGEDRGSTAPPSGATADGTGVVPVVPTPFNSAVSAATDREAEPNYIVGDAVHEDLVLARTLLGAVLAATESQVGMTWAVAVLRGPAGAGMFITSNEGRGWLPAGLYLPRQVSTPWLWDELLGADGDEAAPWEGVADPARVLVEFGRAWGAKANASLSALVSSGPIDPGLRGRLGEVAMEGLVGSAADVNLRVLTPDTADRLGITGSTPALEMVAAVTDSDVRARCVGLAVDAHAQLGRVSIPGYRDAFGTRALRDRILAKVERGEEIPASWWDELRDADDLLATTMISQRLDVGRVDLGAIRVDDEVAMLRALVWERRCNELVALLNQEPDRQVLRDAVYAHGQILEHPAFVTLPATVAAGTDTVVDRPAGAVGSSVTAPGGAAVTAPDAGSGPPPGAVAPPVAPPPETRQSY